MNISMPPDERIKHVSFDTQDITVHLMDGRRISTPLAWYPRLSNAQPQQLLAWEISGAGYGVHWEQLDEDLSVEGMLRGLPAVGYRTNARS